MKMVDSMMCRTTTVSKAINVESDGYSLLLKPLGMAHMGWGGEQMLTQEGAAEYFWELFIAPLQR